MDIVFLGQQGWDHCWTAKQQFATRLAARGHRLVYVDPGLPSPEEAEAARAASLPGMPGLRHRGPGEAYTFTYVPVPALRWRLNLARRPRVVAATLRKLGFVDPVTLCLHPLQADLLPRIGSAAVVYYAVDEYDQYGGMSDEERQRVRAAEDRLLAQADAALAVSAALADRFRRIAPDAAILENGADVEHFHPASLARAEPHPDVPAGEGPVVGFIGQVDGRIDQALVESLARARPSWRFVFAGRRAGADFARLDALPNVTFLGYQPYERLPSFARTVDAFIVPYVESRLTHGCNPLKVYEYLATGRPVVSRDLRGLAICRDVVSLARDHAAFLSALDAAVADPGRGRSDRIARAEANDWNARVDALEDILVRALGAARTRRGAVPRLAPPRRLAPARDPAIATDEYGEPREPAHWQRVRWRGAKAATDLAGALLRLAPPWRRAPRILVARRGLLGDLIALEPALAHLRACRPEAHIALAVPEVGLARALYGRSPLVDEILPLAFTPAHAEMPLQARLADLLALVGRRFDAVLFGAGWFMVEEALLAGAPATAGLFDGHPLQSLENRLLRRDRSRHEAENNLALVEALTGVPAPQERRGPRVWIDASEASRAADAALEGHGIARDAPLLVVHPGTKRPTRRWPMERLIEAVDRLLGDRPELTVVVTGTAGEASVTAPLVEDIEARHAGRIVSLVGRTDLAGLAGILDRARAVLVNDTGVMHLARARGAPLVALFGPENHRAWGPHPSGDAPVRLVARRTPCSPCLLHECGAHYCLSSISVEDVVRAVDELLAGGAEGYRADIAHLSWRRLAAVGFELPRVSVLATTRDPGRVGAIVRMLEEQDYPAIEAVVPAGAGVTARNVALVEVAADGPHGLASRLAAAASGAYLVTLDGPQDWRRDRLSRDVAAAVRTSRADGFRDGRPGAAMRHTGETMRAATARAAITPGARPA